MKATLFAATAFASTAVAQGGCSPLELIYARATTEPKGLGAAGKNLKGHLEKDLPGSTAYAVEYPATMNLADGCKGVKDMIARMKAQSSKCPNQKFALGGHSQGGAVVTAGIPFIPKELLPKIVAVTMFGAPPCSDVPQVKGRCKSFCNKGDTICDSAGPMGGGGPRVKCNAASAGVRYVDPAYAALWTQPWPAETFNATAENPASSLGRRQVKGKGKSAGASSASGGGGGGGGTNGCGDDERGHQVKGSGMSAHMAYKSDGYYTAAASCYITKMFKASGGGGGEPAAAE